MGTYLILLNKLIHQNKWRFFFIIGFPFFLGFIVLPFVTDTLDESDIPIGWVTKEDSETLTTIAERIQEHPRITIIQMTEEEAYRGVKRKEMEAAFILSEKFQEQIKAGKIDELITWIRSEESFFDSFVKEKVASEVMRFALSSKAANDVMMYKGLTDKQHWQSVYQHAEKYWEPEPLFQMKFTPYSSSEADSADEKSVLPKGYAALFGFWMWYAWMIFAVLLLSLYKWKKQGILSRLRIHHGSLVPFYMRFYILTGGFVIFLFLAVSYLSSRSVEAYGYSFTGLLFPSVIILALILLLTISVTYIVKKPSVFLLICMLFSMMSLFFSFLTFVSNEPNTWRIIFPHTWLYQLMS
ncbi:ABC transporter permease [Virgibacillus sp. MSP4-1]|uniref:ABC transporter permease n=1 Tax=Virgibacillus sp. MSP4-1 TaxID=2700081 RepID=UPI0003A43520|nr:ABC transporter permease [Virgibacillus sp. MSP4-1]QHS21558.1 ABC transporter permease [Virgibacillus sp. MSP4-1]